MEVKGTPPEASVSVAAKPREIHITEVNKSENIGHLISFKGCLTEKERTPYIARTHTHMRCAPDPDKPTCQVCPHLDKGEADIGMNIYNSEILSFINQKETNIATIFRQVGQIPQSCKRTKFDKFTTNANLYRCVIIPSIEYVSAAKTSADETIDNMYEIQVNTVLFGDQVVDENKEYMYTGVPHIDPQSGLLVFLCKSAVALTDDISSYDLTPVRKRILERFQCDHTPKAIMEKNEELLREERLNHHKVFGMRRMEYFIDMAFHSVNSFTWRKKPQTRGWLDIGVIGDSRTGKSEYVERKIELYGMGFRLSGENISFAGVGGGMLQSSIKGGQHQLKWGILPRHDRRLVCFDECHTETALPIWPKLNDVRSSGVMRISKIGAVDRTSPARVRKIFIANPPTGKTTRDYYNPCEMLKEIFSTPECVARFDAVYIPRAEDSTRGDEDENETTQPIYFPNAHKQLMRFIYSRTADQVIFTKEAEKYLLEIGEELAKKCDGISLPLIQANEAPLSFARGAAAQAAKVYSVDESGQVIIVHKGHAQVWVDTLMANYAHESTNYFSYSQDMNQRIKFKNAEEFYHVCCEMRVKFDKHRDMVKYLLQNASFNFKYMGDMWDIEVADLKKINGAMIKNSLIDAKASNASFAKTRRGIAVFKYLNNQDVWSLIDEKKCKEYFAKLSI